MPGSEIVIPPGVYAGNPNFGNKRCYFLSAGAYKWQGGYSNNGGLVSNELKPPDEPLISDNTQAANPQFWNLDGAKCAGAFQVNVTGSGGAPMGTWGVKLTSVRTDTYAGVNYQRESAPSRCQSFAVHTAQNISVLVSNVPGATSYNIYLSSNSCSGPFGLVGNIPVTSTPQNNDTAQCPFGNGNGNGNGNNNGNGQGNGSGNGNGNPKCTLGTETLSVPAIVLPSLPLPNLFALAGSSGGVPTGRRDSSDRERPAEPEP